jgi:hypothetical protein
MNVHFCQGSEHNLRLEASVYNVYITKQFQTTFAQWGGGGRQVTVKIARSKTLKTFSPITSKNSSSGLSVNGRTWVEAI